jgi:hypothetical protein
MAWTEPTPPAPELAHARASASSGPRTDVRHPDDLPGPDAAAQEPVSDAGALFAGDCGTLPLDTRQVLVQLLLGPFVDGTRHTGRWAVLVRDEATLRSRLHELFLELVVAHDEKVAFVRQVSENGLEAPILLRRLSLTFLETALLLYLRQCLTQAQAQGERAVVSRDELLEHLSVYERERNADRVKFDQQATRAIQKLRNLNLLRLLRGSGQRFEVAPTLRLLFPAEEILALVRVYKSLAGADPEHADEPTQPADAADAEATPEAQLRREVLASQGANPAAGLEAVLARERRRADALDAQLRERSRTGPGVAGANAARPAQEGGFGGLDQGEVYEGAAEDADDEALEDELDEDFDEGLDEGFDEDDRPAPGSEERP